MKLRWQQVVELAAAGCTDKQIAAEMDLSIHTVETYWRRIRLRYQAPTRITAVLAYFGITPYLDVSSKRYQAASAPEARVMELTSPDNGGGESPD